ncbi:MAG: glutamyl-tRNA amidotransferase [Chlamydiae bacterium SM23_39]|nr:MAG: glutamyl-tRNA amidotransferase [Chlamydiae bacterium SM23_39]
MKNIPYDQWEPIIGLEIHVQLNTKTKLFSSSLNRFGDLPNINIDEVSTGQPGALPVLNEEALFKALKFALATEAKIEKYSRFDRKSYFYPDSPRNFQITQFEKPIMRKGNVAIDIDGKNRKIEIKEAHLEDDTAMLKHFNNCSAIDFNRAGIPLLEIVSEPMIYSPKEAVLYAKAVRSIMQYIDASEGDMEKGNLRIDANISVKPKKERGFRNKVEIKNMNSFSSLEKALSSEIVRQISVYTEHPNEDVNKLIAQETYRWDPFKKQNILMRKKESAEDYKYFPEPDIPPIIVTEDQIKKIKTDLPELPFQRLKRYISQLNLSKYEANMLVLDKNLSDYFEEVLKISFYPKTVFNWITVEFAGKLKEKNETLFSLNIKPVHIGNLINLIEEKKITGKIAKSVIDDMIKYPGKDPIDIVKENPNYTPIDDISYLKSIVDKVVKENSQTIKDYKKGKDKAFSFLVGQVMRLTEGKASPEVVNKLLKKTIQGLG